MSFFNSFLHPNATIRELEKENKTLKATQKKHDKEIEKLQDEIDSFDRKFDLQQREHVEELYDLRKDLQRENIITIKSKDGEIKELELELENLENNIETRVDNIVFQRETELEQKFEKKEKELRDEYKKKLQEAEDKYQKDTEDVQEENFELNAVAARANARAEELASDVSMLQTILKETEQKNERLVKEITQKLPTVDMSKFDINVDVPVTTIETKGGGNKQKN